MLTLINHHSPQPVADRRRIRLPPPRSAGRATRRTPELWSGRPDGTSLTGPTGTTSGDSTTLRLNTASARFQPRGMELKS
jgi:hypothetical protein